MIQEVSHHAPSILHYVLSSCAMLLVSVEGETEIASAAVLNRKY